MSLSLLPIKAANMLIMDTSEQMASQWNDLQEQKPLTLLRRSLSECACYRVDFSFAGKGCPYIVNG